jgi:hypothetical protein
VTAPRRTIEAVVRRARLGEDDDASTLAYWLAQPMARRILAVEALRRTWIDRLGDPDRPMERAITRRRLGDEG